MSLATPNHEDFLPANQAEADKSLLVRFFVKEREDKEATLREGRPMFKETEYIEIRIAGKRDPQACRPVTHADKQRFPEHYRRFQERIEEPAEGTALSEWPQITRSMVEHLTFLNIKTVEQLAATPDSNLTVVHGGLGLKQRAAEFLKHADVTKVIAEKQALEERLQQTEAQMAEMQKTIQQMQAALADKAMGVSAPAPTATIEPTAIDETAAEPEETKTSRRGRRRQTEE